MVKTTKAKLKANRANGGKGRGPGDCTQIRQNALKHRILASKLAVEEKDREKFENLMKDLCADLQPSGTTQELLVEQMAVSWWRKRYVLLAEKSRMRPTFAADSIDPERLLSERTDLLQRYDTSIDRQFYRALRTLKELQSKKEGAK